MLANLPAAIELSAQWARRIISFGQAERIAHDLAKGLEAGEIDAWKWAGEFSVCPFLRSSGQRGPPLVPALRIHSSRRGGKTAANGRSLGSSY